MTCSGDGTTGTKTEKWRFENWARTQVVLVPVVYNPTTVEELVAAVLEVEGRQETLKAIGSGWAYGGVAVDDSTQNVIHTGQLTKQLSGSDGSKGLIPFALRAELKPEAAFYVHVEAGVPVWRLNCMLAQDHLAMPTLGGNNGQTIAGAISTGTHGADVKAPPIADAVAAIHLVGPGGQEWWIERDEDAGAITDPARMEQAKTRGSLCPDARVEYDTSLFRAVLVSMGRMGVVYSFVLKAVDRFQLKTTRYTSTWSVERARLRNPQNPFAAHDTTRSPPYDLSKQVRWLEIFVNPYPDSSGDHPCVVTQKDVGGPPLAADDPESGDAFQAFCRSDAITQLLVELNLALPPIIGTVLASVAPALAPLLGIPVVGPWLYTAAIASIVAPYTVVQTELSRLLVENPGGNFAAQLANFVNHLVEIHLKSFIPTMVSMLAGSVRPLSEDGKTRESFQSYTGQKACPADPEDWTGPTESSNCERQIDGMELAFDMRPGKANVFDFIDDVIAASDAMNAADNPAAFGMAMRFTGKTEALLGMQQWERTCIIELFALRGVRSTQEWIKRLYDIGARHGAIPHWGLLNELTAAQVRDRYPKLSEWRQALRFIIDGGGGRAETFRSNYSIQRGLEPETFVPAQVDVPVVGESGETYPYDFGTVQLHDQKSVVFHFANDGQHELRVLGHDAEGDFATRSGPGTSAPENLEVVDVKRTALPNEEIRVRATFSAQRGGEHRGKLKIYVNAANLGAIVIPVHARVEVFSLALVQTSPAQLATLGAVPVGSTVTETLVVRNDSTIAAELDHVTFSNPRAASQIAVQTGGIAIGQTRAFALEYRPAFVGPFDTEVILHFTDGAIPPRHAQTLIAHLSAIGRGAQAELSPDEFDFGSAPMGADSQSTWFTLRNIGLEPLSISGPLIGGDYRLLSSLPATVPGGQSVRLEVLFRPAGVGARDSSFSVSSNSLYPPKPIDLHGVGIAAPVLRATPSAVSFDDTVVGSARIATVGVRNPGAVPVSIGTVGLQAPGDFRILRDRCAGATLQPGGASELDVAFEPAGAGPKANAVEISGPPEPLAVPLSGLALPALGLVPSVSDVDFGEVPVGKASSIAHVTLTNAATADAHVTDVLIQGSSAAEVSVVATDCAGATLVPGASCGVDLQLQPADIGTRSAVLSADADVPAHAASLHALGRAASVAWNVAELDFGDMNVGVQTPAQTASFRNTGNAPLTVTQIEVADDAADFVVTELTPGITTLRPNGELGFRIRFRPTASGDRHGTLRIHSDAAGSPHALSLDGVGHAPPP